MNFTDVIKNKFIEEFTDIPFTDILVSLILSFLLGIFVVLIYKITFSGVVFNSSFAVSLVLLSMVTSVVVLCISSNLVLSLGMVGALSIVRFRTAVKEVNDTVFMFWAITVGIITGAKFILVSIISTLIIGVLFVLISSSGNLLSKIGISTGNGYLVVLLYDSRVAPEITRALSNLPKYKIKSKSSSGNFEELVIELKMGDKDFELLNKLKRAKGVEEVNIISHAGSSIL
ncbi:MAG: DUF4956 domain-containing protein [Ruminococcaceae bacterium]|nr:DUF4956 domain-containing protein [Oscillospiraceae bacterium]